LNFEIVSDFEFRASDFRAAVGGWFGYMNFEIVSDFEFRASDFRAAAQRQHTSNVTS
jgi:hypothetical protein